MILTCPVRFHIGKYQSNLRSRVKLSFEREMYSHNDRHMIEGTSCDNNRTIMWDTWQRCRWIQKYKTILKTQRGCSSRTGSPQWRYVEKKRFRELKSENPPRYNNSHRFIRIKLHLVWLEACPIKRSIVDCNLPGNGPDSYFFSLVLMLKTSHCGFMLSPPYFSFVKALASIWFPGVDSHIAEISRGKIDFLINKRLSIKRLANSSGQGFQHIYIISEVENQLTEFFGLRWFHSHLRCDFVSYSWSNVPLISSWHNILGRHHNIEPTYSRKTWHI